MNTTLDQPLTEILTDIHVRAWRLCLDTCGVEVTVPLLRGVWGAALHRRAPDVYQALFEGSADRVPAYVLRPAPAPTVLTAAVDFIVFGRAPAAAEREVWAAWDDALRAGLGSQRVPARLVQVRPLAWDGTPLSPGITQPGFPLWPLSWPLRDPATPCVLRFPSPLRLLRDGRLIIRPTVADLTVAALRRIQSLVPSRADAVRVIQPAILDLAREIPAYDWLGESLDLRRYSGRQRTEIEMRGVVGELVLPEGPGPLADLLLAATWTHLGKSTVMGLGQLLIDPADFPPGR